MTESTQSSQRALEQWRVELDTTWDALGPFPIHAREQHVLAPAFPLNLSLSIDYQRTWPSAYGDGGSVSWSKVIANGNGDLEVSFPDVRWKDIRATEGWAALQHHAILRTTLTVYPPSSVSVQGNIPHLLVDLRQGSYFAIKARSQVSGFIPQWFAGNIYDLNNALPHAVPLPVSPSMAGEPTVYDLFVSGDYEIRLFGDPLVDGNELPAQKLAIRVQIQEPSSHFAIHQKSQDVICDFLDGYAFGNVFGFGIQSLKGWWTIENVELDTPDTGMSLKLPGSRTVIAPLQTRTVPLSIQQTSPFNGTNLKLRITLRSGSLLERISISFDIIQRKLLSPERHSFRGTYLFAGSSPTAFLAFPPALDSYNQHPPVLSLHGAGVDILNETFWEDAMPNVRSAWTVFPTGRTSWGLDWHGSSTQDAWLCLEGLSTIIRNRAPGLPDSWSFPKDSNVILIGHSNGGQGVWHIASRYPDRVLAAIPAAGYIKSQAYVPLTMSRSGHYIDPALRFILESSFTPDDHDLHISNLVNIPILAIHGGADENVPVWHTRELVAAYKTWNSPENITYLEDKGGGHWYPFILNRPEVDQFITRALSGLGEPKALSDSFTLTVANPRECGSLNGWRIHCLLIPGRLARLYVRRPHKFRFDVDPSNVHIFSIADQGTPYEVFIENQSLGVRQSQGEVHILRDSTGTWKVADASTIAKSQPPGRLQCVLSTTGPISIIISDVPDAEHSELLAAQRLAHILQLYHRIDTQIITEAEIRAGSGWPIGNIVFIGHPSSQLVKKLLDLERTPVRVKDDILHVGRRPFDKAEQAAIFSHPHPTGEASASIMVFLLYNSVSSLERALRLFPYRTGVAVPDWLVAGEKMDSIGAGGIEAAGVWGTDWTLSDAMTWY